MTLPSIIVLLLFVLMWLLSSFEINSRNKLIKKLDAENEDNTNNYNQLVKDYNEIVDFLEKHHTPEEFKELFDEHRIDEFIGKNTGMNKETEDVIRKHLRESLAEEE